MAKIYSPPKGFEPPEFDASLSWDEHDKREQKWLKRLTEWVKINGSGKYAGVVIHEGVADGCAQYMVFSLIPVVLIHIPLGDAYQSRWAHRWTAGDVKKMAENALAMKEMFSQSWDERRKDLTAENK